jgi:hypothetical protein
MPATALSGTGSCPAAVFAVIDSIATVAGVTGGGGGAVVQVKFTTRASPAAIVTVCVIAAVLQLAVTGSTTVYVPERRPVSEYWPLAPVVTVTGVPAGAGAVRVIVIDVFARAEPSWLVTDPEIEEV